MRTRLTEKISLFPYTTLFRSVHLVTAPIAKLRGRLSRLTKWTIKGRGKFCRVGKDGRVAEAELIELLSNRAHAAVHHVAGDRKSTRLNSSHVEMSYAVFCLKK